MASRRKFIGRITTSTFSLPLLFEPMDIFDFPPQQHNDSILRVTIMGLCSYATGVANAMQSCKRAKLVRVVSDTPSKSPIGKKSTIFQRSIVIPTLLLMKLMTTMILTPFM